MINGAINNSMIKYRHLIPEFDNIINKLHESLMFSKIDLKIDYYQIKMKEGDIEKNNFKTKYILFEWFMLFSLTIANNNLMRLMKNILCAFINSFVINYFDDIHSKNLGECIKHL